MEVMVSGNILLSSDLNCVAHHYAARKCQLWKLDPAVGSRVDSPYRSHILHLHYIRANSQARPHTASFCSSHIVQSHT